jgi:diacylglycerol kinase (ATP)
VAALDPALKERAGRLAFVSAFLVRLWHYRACELIVRADGIDHRAAGVIAAKGRYYGGPFVVAPHASLTDPAFELVLFRRAGRGAILRYAVALFLGRIARLGDVAILRAGTATVIGERSVPVQADGEIVGHLPAAIAIAEHPLLLIRPVP